MGTLIIILILVLAVGLALRSIIRNRKKGVSLSCGGNCANCAGNCSSTVTKEKK